MSKRLIIIIVIAVVALGAVGTYFFLTGNEETNTPAPTPAPAQTTPPAATTAEPDTAKLRAELEAAEENYKNDSANAAANAEAVKKARAALRNGILKTRPHLSNGDTLYYISIPNTRGHHSGTHNPKQSRTISNASAGGQNISSNYRAPSNPVVSTSVSGGNVAKGLFCVNLRDMDNASYWPTIAIESGVKIEGSVLNGSKDGYNISIFPVDEISGLYGITTGGEMFVQASLLDSFGPTIVKMSGSPNGWKSWAEAELLDVDGVSYYVASGN